MNNPTSTINLNYNTNIQAISKQIVSIIPEQTGINTEHTSVKTRRGNVTLLKKEIKGKGKEKKEIKKKKT